MLEAPLKREIEIGGVHAEDRSGPAQARGEE
jgi:hypothetical protein